MHGDISFRFANAFSGNFGIARPAIVTSDFAHEVVWTFRALVDGGNQAVGAGYATMRSGCGNRFSRWRRRFVQQTFGPFLSISRGSESYRNAAERCDENRIRFDGFHTYFLSISSSIFQVGFRPRLYNADVGKNTRTIFY
jgi:hypothetical protein